MRPLLSPGMVFVNRDGAVYTRREYLIELVPGGFFEADVRLELQHAYLQDVVFIAVELITGGKKVEGKPSVQRVCYAATWIRNTNGRQNQVIQLTAIALGVALEIDLGVEATIDVD